MRAVMAHSDPFAQPAIRGAFSGLFPEEELAADDGPRENRLLPRRVVEVAGRYRERAGTSRDIWIKDISENGCRFFDKFSVLAVDSLIMFRIGTIGPFNAKVRWREQNIVGVEFENPLHPSVLEHIVKTMDMN